MKARAILLSSIAVAMVSWGVYGPVLQKGKLGMHGSALLPFVFVGVAYFLIAILAPAILLKLKGEAGGWTTTGIIWSLAAGAAGALGALGVILALGFGGSPVYVMPLVFGCAPVVNTLLTMYWARSYKQVSPIFMAGLILVVLGAVTVLLTRPNVHAAAHPPAAGAEAKVEAKTESKLQAVENRLVDWVLIMSATAMTAVCWGVYGPILHRGASAMSGSRLRPFICVGVSYFLIAVIVPLLLLAVWKEPGYTRPESLMELSGGAIWSLFGGAAGAFGALGIIMSFNFGGRPIFVMPLVFGGAPVINTFVSLWGAQFELTPLFYAGLIIVAAGAVVVLVSAPKPTAGAHGPPPSKPAAEKAAH